jgi:hypothetical protein
MTTQNMRFVPQRLVYFGTVIVFTCFCCIPNTVVTSFQPSSTTSIITNTISSSSRQSTTFCYDSSRFKNQQQGLSQLSIIVPPLYASNKSSNKLLDNDIINDQIVNDNNDNDNKDRLERFEKVWDSKFNDDVKDTIHLPKATAAAVVSTTLATVLTASTSVMAESVQGVVVDNKDFFSGISQGNLNPATFQPVCAASDSFYRILQQTTLAIVGKENFIEYGPLIAGGLLRVRLELCVVESFFNEAVGPFIQQNGVAWILPLHETVETFLAGGIFAIATTFILVGSTKLLTVVATYTDFIFGFPSRFIGGFIFDRAIGKPVTVDLNLGPWFKPRLFGPPKPTDGQPDPALSKEYKIETNSLSTFVVLAIFGIIKFFGEALKVQLLIV